MAEAIKKYLKMVVLKTVKHFHLYIITFFAFALKINYLQIESKP